MAIKLLDNDAHRVLANEVTFEAGVGRRDERVADRVGVSPGHMIAIQRMALLKHRVKVAAMASNDCQGPVAGAGGRCVQIVPTWRAAIFVVLVQGLFRVEDDVMHDACTYMYPKPHTHIKRYSRRRMQMIQRALFEKMGRVE